MIVSHGESSHQSGVAGGMGSCSSHLTERCGRTSEGLIRLWDVGDVPWEHTIAISKPVLVMHSNSLAVNGYSVSTYVVYTLWDVNTAPGGVQDQVGCNLLTLGVLSSPRYAMVASSPCPGAE